jgi:hypothetical protein
VVVFIIGGFTYEEAAAVHQLNASLGLQVQTELSLFIALHHCGSGPGLEIICLSGSNVHPDPGGQKESTEIFIFIFHVLKRPMFSL